MKSIYGINDKIGEKTIKKGISYPGTAFVVLIWTLIANRIAEHDDVMTAKVIGI
jgi:hypothetical protein